MEGAGLRTVRIKTDGTGAFTESFFFRGRVLAVRVEVGDLSTPDMVLTEESTPDLHQNILTVAGIAADGTYYPQVATSDPSDGTAGDDFVSPAVFGKAKLAITGGGANKSGQIRILYG